LVAIFRPLANCIAIAESESSYLSEFAKSLLDFSESLLRSNREKPFVNGSVEALLEYFVRLKKGGRESDCISDNLGLPMAAYFLDRRYKMDFITEDGREKVLNL